MLVYASQADLRVRWSALAEGMGLTNSGDAKALGATMDETLALLAREGGDFEDELRRVPAAGVRHAAAAPADGRAAEGRQPAAGPPPDATDGTAATDKTVGTDASIRQPAAGQRRHFHTRRGPVSV